jgi:hypothetical protein
VRADALIRFVDMNALLDALAAASSSRSAPTRKLGSSRAHARA